MDGAAGSNRNEDVAPVKAGTAQFGGDSGPAGRTTKLSQSFILSALSSCAYLNVTRPCRVSWENQT